MPDCTPGPSQCPRCSPRMWWWGVHKHLAMWCNYVSSYFGERWKELETEKLSQEEELGSSGEKRSGEERRRRSEENVIWRSERRERERARARAGATVQRKTRTARALCGTLGKLHLFLTDVYAFDVRVWRKKKKKAQAYVSTPVKRQLDARDRWHMSGTRLSSCVFLNLAPAHIFTRLLFFCWTLNVGSFSSCVLLSFYPCFSPPPWLATRMPFLQQLFWLLH